jgi:hypothetical protein
MIGEETSLKSKENITMLFSCFHNREKLYCHSSGVLLAGGKLARVESNWVTIMGKIIGCFSVNVEVFYKDGIVEENLTSNNVAYLNEGRMLHRTPGKWDFGAADSG